MDNSELYGVNGNSLDKHQHSSELRQRLDVTIFIIIIIIAIISIIINCDHQLIANNRHDCGVIRLKVSRYDTNRPRLEVVLYGIH